MQEKLEKVLDTAWYTPMHIFVKVETQSSSDIDCKKSSHPDQLGIELGVCIASIKFPSYELIRHFIIFYLVPLPPYFIFWLSP